MSKFGDHWTNSKLFEIRNDVNPPFCIPPMTSTASGSEQPLIFIESVNAENVVLDWKKYGQPSILPKGEVRASGMQVKPVIVRLGTGIKQQGCGGSKQKKMGNLSSTWENMAPGLEYATIFKDADASVLRVLHPVPPKKANLIGDFLVKTLQSKMKQPKNPSKSLHCQNEVHTFL